MSRTEDTEIKLLKVTDGLLFVMLFIPTRPSIGCLDFVKMLTHLFLCVYSNTVF